METLDGRYRLYVSGEEGAGPSGGVMTDFDSAVTAAFALARDVSAKQAPYRVIRVEIQAAALGLLSIPVWECSAWVKARAGKVVDFG